MAIALTFPLFAPAAPYLLNVPPGEVRLIPACRLLRWQDPMYIALGLEPPSFHSLYKFDRGSQGFVIYILGMGAWAPSEPFFFHGEGAVAADGDLLFEARTAPNLPLGLVTGLNLVCCQSDTEASFEDIVGRAPENGTVLYRFNPGPNRRLWPVAPPDYTTYTFTNGAWFPEAPVVGITEAVFVYQPPKLSNVQMSGGHLTFEVGTPPSTTVTIEYCDSLMSGAWQTLTNLAGNGATVRVTDASGGPAVTQRFYRARITQ